VFNGTTAHQVARAEAAVGIDHGLGHQEQRDPLRPGWRIRQLGQDQMDNVFGEVVLATGDKDLGPADFVGAVRLRLGLGPDNPQVCAGMGLGQAHGTGPFTGIHLRQVGSLELFAGMGVDRYARARRQHRIQTKRQARRVDHLFNLGRHRLGHAHTAKHRIAADTDPAAFSVGFVGLWIAIRGKHRRVVPAAALLIATPTQRGDGFGGDFAGFLEDRLDSFGVNAVCQCRQLGPCIGDLKNFVEDEAHITQRRFVISHGKPRENGKSDSIGSVLQAPSVPEQLFRHIGSTCD